MITNTRETTNRLLDYCRGQDWAGYDPYDALNSRVFSAIPFFRNRLCRIAFTQFMKRSPVNFRPLLGVSRKRNPKGTALFISALLKLKQADLPLDDGSILSLVDDLMASRSSGQTLACWGYSFDWQTRGYLVPEGSPNIICTTFAGNALLDAWEAYHTEEYLKHGDSAARFLVDQLYEEMAGGEACFNYTPLSSSRIHNANLLGAAYLSRVAKAENHGKWGDLIMRAARYSVRKQAPDGSWPYGEASTQQWIDNFHTGYNLCALQTIAECTGTEEFNEAIQKGLAFYNDHFFTRNGVPKYFHNKTYPIDIHSVAQSVITLARFRNSAVGNMELAERVAQWAISHMMSRQGYFYYQRGPCYANTIPYMRWSQAWMLLALSSLLNTK